MKDLRDSVAVVTGAASGVGLGIAEVLAAGARARRDRRRRRGGGRAGRRDAEGRRGTTRSRSRRTSSTAHRSTRWWDTCSPATDASTSWRRTPASIRPSRSRTCPTPTSTGSWTSTSRASCTRSRRASPPMRERGYGRIVLTSSITGPLVGAPNLAHYAASKAAVLGLMRSAALEVIGDGITVNAVMPGNVRTPGIEQFGAEFVQGMIDAIPMKRLAEPSRRGVGGPLSRVRGGGLHHRADPRDRWRPGASRGAALTS